MNLPLTPGDFAFKRTAIAIPDRMIRAFNDRGAVSIRDHTVTGLQFLQFTRLNNRIGSSIWSFVELALAASSMIWRMWYGTTTREQAKAFTR